MKMSTSAPMTDYVVCVGVGRLAVQAIILVGNVNNYRKVEIPTKVTNCS